MRNPTGHISIIKCVTCGTFILVRVTECLPLSSFPTKLPLRTMPAAQKVPLAEEPPPFLRTWERVYAAVLVYLAVLIATLYLLTRLFAP